jgi:hypothetical protein
VSLKHCEAVEEKLGVLDRNVMNPWWKKNEFWTEEQRLLGENVANVFTTGIHRKCCDSEMEKPRALIGRVA